MTTYMNTELSAPMSEAARSGLAQLCVFPFDGIELINAIKDGFLGLELRDLCRRLGLTGRCFHYRDVLPKEVA